MDSTVVPVFLSPILSTRSPHATTNFTFFAMNCWLRALTMSTAHEPGFLPSSVPLHWVSAITPNFHDCAADTETAANMSETVKVTLFIQEPFIADHQKFPAF